MLAISVSKFFKLLANSKSKKSMLLHLNYYV